ncbi:MAG: hypothetical protein H0X42_12610 [Solirubrobacterales bacterium]|nr:hypothetical protein [Solirubrobacterales bacterium]
MIARVRTLYGASPLHLLAVIASFAIAGYAFFRLAGTPTALQTFIWFAGAAVAHDLIAFPLYSGLNLIARRSLAGPLDNREEDRRVPVVNHLRIPVFLSALSLLLFFPEILGLNSSNYADDTGLGGDVFLTRWIGLCAALFLGSAVVYAVRLRRVARDEDEEEEDGGSDDRPGAATEAGSGTDDA